jgi:hypothetical protein
MNRFPQGRELTKFFAAGAAVLVAGSIGFLRFQAAPFRILPSSEWVLKEPIEQIPVDENIKRMISRAQRDYILRPGPGLRGFLSFKRAVRVPPNDVYLVFVLSSHPFDTEIYYRVALEDGKLLWKCGAGTY